MGFLLSKLKYAWNITFGKPTPFKIVMLGLDAAGKSTLLYKLRDQNVVTIPTVGFNLEVVNPFQGVFFSVWDIGGGDNIKQLWRQYFQNTAGIMFIVDSSDTDRLSTAKEALYKYILECEEARNIPIFVVANKQDISVAMSPTVVANELSLQTITDREWFIHGGSGKTGFGLTEIMRIMKNTVKYPKR